MPCLTTNQLNSRSINFFTLLTPALNAQMHWVQSLPVVLFRKPPCCLEASGFCEGCLESVAFGVSRNKTQLVRKDSFTDTCCWGGRMKRSFIVSYAFTISSPNDSRISRARIESLRNLFANQSFRTSLK
jgi:hypothetical protein